MHRFDGCWTKRWRLHITTVPTIFLDEKFKFRSRTNFLITTHTCSAPSPFPIRFISADRLCSSWDTNGECSCHFWYFLMFPCHLCEYQQVLPPAHIPNQTESERIFCKVGTWIGGSIRHGKWLRFSCLLLPMMHPYYEPLDLLLSYCSDVRYNQCQYWRFLMSISMLMHTDTVRMLLFTIAFLKFHQCHQIKITGNSI